MKALRFLWWLCKKAAPPLLGIAGVLGLGALASAITYYGFWLEVVAVVGTLAVCFWLAVLWDDFNAQDKKAAKIGEDV